MRRRLIKTAVVMFLVLAVIGAVVWAGWPRIAVMVAPKKQAATARSEAAVKADELFWQTFHNGEYENIQNALDVLTAAYLQLIREGYFMLLDATKAWPEFNLFTGGYIMSRLPADSPRFREGLEWQWRNLDVCIEGKIDRANPDFSPYISKETKEGQKRVCWNSWIAPHNFEGFFLNMGVTVLERHVDGPAPFVKVRVALSGMSTGQKFAKRFVAAWVYPDHTGRNFGLRALRVKLNELIVRDNADPFSKGDGDWRFWAVIPSLSRPWTKLIDCEGCVEEKTYTPSSGIFRSGAFDSEGALTGEVLLFDRQSGSLQLTGFESDSLTSDDAGNVFQTINSAPSSSTIVSKCNDQTVGGLNDVDPSTSGCAAYTVKYEVVAGRTPVTATLSPEMTRFAQQLLVRATDRDRMLDIHDTELYTLDQISDDRARLTVGRRGELDPWQSALATARLGQEMRAGNPEPMLKDLRKHIQQSLGPQPREKHPRKIALELQELKKSVPPALYQKYLCDLETGKPCPVP